MTAAAPQNYAVTTPPHSIEAEQSVIGALMLDSRAYWKIAGSLKAEDFYRREHRAIFTAAEQVIRSGCEADVVTIEQELEGKINGVDLAYLASLANNTPSAANVAAYANIVRERSYERRLRSTAAEVLNGSTDTDTLNRLGSLIAESGQSRRDAHQRLAPVDLSALADCNIDPTRYVIAPLLPRQHVTLLAAHGGAGKSMLAETFAAHTATGTSWAGLPTERGRVLFVSLEDPGDLARFRLRRICDAYGLPHSGTVGNLQILDGSNADSVLAAEVMESGVRRMVFTAALDEIEAASEGRSLIVIDNASDAFAGNENDRQLVRTFVRRLAHIARKHDCAVLLLAHVDKTAARHGSHGNSYSGSTAWHNTVRSRVALVEEEGGLSLVQEKLNLGKKVEPICLEWGDHGVLVPVATTGTAAADRDAQDDADVLAAIQAAIADGATVHAARSGSHSTLAVLATYPELPTALRKDRARFWRAMTRLERQGCVSQERYKNTYRKDRVRLSVRASVPHTPSALTRAPVRASASVDRETHRRMTGAPTHCQRCDDAGCDWCQRRSGVLHG